MTYTIAIVRLVWGSWREERVGCQTPFCFFRLHQSIVSVLLREKTLQNSIFFAQNSEKAGVTLWLKCDLRHAWHLLWYGGTVILLGSWLLATSQPWMDCTTLNNPALHCLTQRSFP